MKIKNKNNKYTFYTLTMEEGKEVKLYPSNIVLNILLDIQLQGMASGDWNNIINKIKEALDD